MNAEVKDIDLALHYLDDIVLRGWTFLDAIPTADWYSCAPGLTHVYKCRYRSLVFAEWCRRALTLRFKVPSHQVSSRVNAEKLNVDSSNQLRFAVDMFIVDRVGLEYFHVGSRMFSDVIFVDVYTYD